MREVEVRVPIRVRLTGMPTAEDLVRLEAAVARLVARRMAQANQALAGLRPAAVTGDVSAVPYSFATPHELARDVGDGYRIPSYQDGGRPTTVPLTRPAADSKTVIGTLIRVELYLAEHMLVAVRDGGSPLVFLITEPPKVTPGASFLWTYRDGTHVLSVGRRREVLVKFRGLRSDLETFAQLASRSTVPAVVYSGAGSPPASDGSKSTDGERAEPLATDETVFAKDAALAGLYLDFLARYASVAVDRRRAANGLTVEQVRTITGHNERAMTVTRYFTQGWKEFQASIGGHDLALFTVLEETVLTQWERGNYTALHNLLEIGKGSDGVGLYRRGTILRYYDDNGAPVGAIGGGFRDSGYRAAAPPSIALRIPITDRGLQQVFEAIRHVTLDEQILIYKAAKGYADNRDLLWPEVRNGWDGWKDVDAELQRQLPYFVGFLAGYLVATVLQKAPDLKVQLIGTTLEEILTIIGRIFHVVFVGELGVLAYRCGYELSHVRREEGKPLDALSQRHLATAAIHMRQLLTMLVAAQLTAAVLKVAETTAITLEPPKGGGLVPATATAGAPPSGAGAGAAGVAGTVPRPPVGVPRPPAQLREGDGDSPSGGMSGGREERGSEGRNQEPRRETGEEKERRELREDRPSRPAKGPEYFDYEGGQRGSFREFVARLRTHIAKTVRSGSSDPLPRLNDAEQTLSQKTDAFIKSRDVLRRIWDGWDTRLARQLLSLDGEIRAARADQARVRELTRRMAELEKAKAELEEFGKGYVGDKRPDLVELFLPRRTAEVTDITQRPLDDPIHNFKTQFYVEVIKSLTGWNNVSGREYGSPTNQRLITDPSETSK